MKIFYLPLTIHGELPQPKRYDGDPKYGLRHTVIRVQNFDGFFKAEGPGVWPFTASSAEALLLECDKLRSPDVERSWTFESLGVVL